jgi:hypothetical protein
MNRGGGNGVLSSFIDIMYAAGNLDEKMLSPTLLT